MTVSCVAEPCDAMQLDLHKGVQEFTQLRFDDFDD